MEKKTPLVSIIVPVLNEEKYILGCLSSIQKQTYPHELVEVIIVDGCSTDQTVNLCRKFESDFNLCIYENVKQKTTYALNIGIEKAKGVYILRLDAHAEYPEDYIEKCIYYLDTMNVDNVGGIVVTKGKNKMGQAIACMLSSKFGVGDSTFRTNGKSGYVDTVPFGAFRKEVFSKIGLFNNNLPRSEDNDINARIRANNGKVWLANDIKSTYYCRDTVKDILKMALQNGNALFRTLKENPKAMSFRHFIPFLFTISLIILPLISIFILFFKILFVLELGLYFLLDLIFSLEKNSIKYSYILIWLYPAFHIAYGIGSFLGLINIDLY